LRVEDTERSRYQQGSIRLVARATGFAWEVRFSAGKVRGKQTYKSRYFKAADYPAESAVRKALQHTGQIQNDTAERIKVDAKFAAITTIYRKELLPGLHR